LTYPTLGRCRCPTFVPYTTLFRSFGLLLAPRQEHQISHVEHDADLELGSGLAEADRGLRRWVRQMESADELGAADPEFLERRLRSEEHTSELQSRENLVCRLLLEK